MCSSDLKGAAESKLQLEMPMRPEACFLLLLSAAALLKMVLAPGRAQPGRSRDIGREVAVPRHLEDGEEFSLPVVKLIEYGQKLFTANWTVQEGAGRPLTKGTGAPPSMSWRR